MKVGQIKNAILIFDVAMICVFPKIHSVGPLCTLFSYAMKILPVIADLLDIFISNRPCNLFKYATQTKFNIFKI